VADITLGTTPSVRLVGKGRKTRYCPLWPATAVVIKRLVTDRAPHGEVFLNNRGQPLTRFGIYNLVQRAVERARATTPSLKAKCVGPHSVRHYISCLTMSCHTLKPLILRPVRGAQ
jgi:integrase